MAEQKKKPSPRQYCISRVKKIIKADYDFQVTQKNLPKIRAVLLQMSQGDAIFAQVEKLVEAKNGDRAIKLLEIAPFRSKKLIVILAAGVALLTIGGVLLALLHG